MKNLVLVLAALVLTGCATTQTTSSDRTTRILTAVTKLNGVTDRIMRRAGPVVLTGVCITQPQYCVPAKAAYALALSTHNEITVLIQAAKAANEAPDGTKLATLAQKFVENIDSLNRVVALYGGTKVDLAEFQATYSECQTLSTQ